MSETSRFRADLGHKAVVGAMDCRAKVAGTLMGKQTFDGGRRLFMHARALIVPEAMARTEEAARGRAVREKPVGRNERGVLVRGE
jgi:hypothetical protein